MAPRRLFAASTRRPEWQTALVAVVLLLLFVGAGTIAHEPGVGLLIGLAIALAFGWVSLAVHRSFNTLREQTATRQEMRDLWGLSAAFVDGRPWPPPGGWALDASALSLIITEIRTRRAKTVVELGPGTSSIVLGRSCPGLAMYGVEHDDAFVISVRHQLAMHGLTEYVLLHAPLQVESIYDGRSAQWYDRASLAELPNQIDVLIVDGPPNGLGQGNRVPAWEALSDRLSRGSLILVDDTNRPDERAMVNHWLGDDRLRMLRDNYDFVLLEVQDRATNETGERCDITRRCPRGD